MSAEERTAVQRVTREFRNRLKQWLVTMLTNNSADQIAKRPRLA